jgi:hypothetical protein
MRRLAAGVVVFAALAVAGCSPADPAVVHWQPAMVSANEPRQALDASVGALAGTSYAMKLSNGGNTAGSGVADWATHSAQLKVTLTDDLTRNVTEAVTVAGEFWVRLDYGRVQNRNLGITANAWTRIDPAKLRAVTALPIDISGTNDDNPFDMHGWTRAVVTVDRVDATHLRGTVDLLKAGGVLGPTANGKQSLRTGASTAPFTATLDEQGRLTRFTVNAADVNPELSYDITFTGYGAPVTIQRPAKAADASAKLYGYFDGTG